MFTTRKVLLGTSKQRGGAEGLLVRMRGAQGGANPRIKQRADMAEAHAQNEVIPWIIAKIYSPSPIINMEQKRSEGSGMVNRVYVPVEGAKEAPRTVANKIANWISKGEWK